MQHELKELGVQQTQEGEPQITNDDISIRLLDKKSGYFHRKEAWIKPQIKMIRQNMKEQVQSVVTGVKDSMREEFAKVKNTMMIEFEGKLEKYTS